MTTDLSARRRHTRQRPTGHREERRSVRREVQVRADLANGIGWCSCAQCAPTYEAPPLASELRLDALIAATRAGYQEVGAQAADEQYRSGHEADPVFATRPVILSIGSRHSHPGTSGFVAESTRAAVADVR